MIIFPLKFSGGETKSRLVVSNSLQPHGLYSPWNSPGQNTGVGSLSLLQQIFPTQGLNPGLEHKRRCWSIYGRVFKVLNTVSHELKRIYMKALADVLNENMC